MQFIQKIKGCNTAILDTRKTTPGLRALEKYAVRCGGGQNHRFNLKEMILIKDNHKAVLSDEGLLIKKIRLAQSLQKPITIETDNLIEFKKILKLKPDIILLDNMPINQIRKAVKIVKSIKGKGPLLEASGGINLMNVKKFAQTGVDRISIGALTHTHQAINLSLEMIS